MLAPKNPAKFKQRGRRPGRISSWNDAGTTLFLGLVGGPALLAFSAFLILCGPMIDEQGRPDWIGPYFFATIVSGLALFLVYRAVTAAVLWIEVGDDLRIRKLLHTVTRRWDQVETVEYETDQGCLPLMNTPIPGIGIDVKFPKHQILIVVFRDKTMTQVEVTEAHTEIVQELVHRYLEARHYREHGKVEA